MRKSYLLLTFAVVFAMMFGKLQADYAKFPLMERFTNASCGPCAIYNYEGYSDWVDTSHSKLAIISYQVSWPGIDPMYTFNKDVPNTRVSFYDSVDANGIDGVPSVAFNGVLVGYPQSNGSLSSTPDNDMLDSLLERESAKRSPMQVTPKLEIVNDTARISVEIISEEAMNNVCLQVVIVQSVCDYEIAPGTNEERIFPYVARYALPNMEGTSFTIGANDTLTFPFQQALSSELTKQQRLYVVAFVEPSNSSKSNTHSIVQAGMSVVTPPVPEVMYLFPYRDILYGLTTGAIYAKSEKDSVMTHGMLVENNTDYDVVVDVKESSVTKEWEIVSSAVPASKPVLAPKEKITFESKIKYVGETPSCLVDTITATVRLTEESLSTLGDVIVLPATVQIEFVNVSSNTKHAYITGIAPADVAGAYAAFSNATYFKKEPGNTLVNIPYFVPQLFTRDILDSLEFLGMGTADYEYWLADQWTDINGLAPISRKLQSLTKTKLFLSLDSWTFFAHNSEDEMYRQELAEYCEAANKFLEDMFGVASNEQPWMVYANDDVDFTPVEATGVDEEISPNFPTLSLNSGSIYNETFVGFFTDLDATTTTPAYTVMTDAYKDQPEPHPVPIMAKYDNGITKRLITSFNFAIIPTKPADNPPLFEVANAIIDWMFPSNFIEDGETNLSTKNGILLSTYPNPVTSVSNLIVHNTNDMPVSAKVYLLDVSGKMVMALFDGTLPVGNSNIELSNSNISAGTYFVVTETAAGKTYMSIAMSK